MWQAKLLSKSKTDGKLSFSVEYSNSETDEKFVENHQTINGKPENWLSEEVGRKISLLENLAVFEASLTENQQITVISPDEAGTDKQKKQKEYRTALDKLRIQKELVDLGVLSKAEAKIVSLIVEVKKLLAEYEGM